MAAGLIRIDVGQSSFDSGQEATRYVGIQTDIRKSAVLLSACWRDFAGRVNVSEPLVLADHLLQRRLGLPCGGLGCFA